MNIQQETRQATFMKAALRNDLDEETAYTFCQLINAVGGEIKSYNWDWEWFKEKRGNYRSLINRSLVSAAWPFLADREWLSLQTSSEEEPRIGTIAPLESLINLRSLSLQDNYVSDLRPLSKMSKLKRLTIYRNKVSNVAPLVNLQSLEELNLAHNPIESLSELERIANLRWLGLSTDQVAYFARCKRLPSVQVLEIVGETPVENVANFPEMPSLKVLRLHRLKHTTGIDRFPSLTTLELIHGQFVGLDGLGKLKGLTHLEAWSSHHPLSLQPLSTLYALRCVEILAPRVVDLSALSRLAVLHEVRIGDANDSEKITCNRRELEALCKSLTPWSDEFSVPEKKINPSLAIEIVSQDAFDYYDDDEARFGIKPDECDDGMFASERKWLQDELIASIEAINFKHGDNKDFFVTSRTGFARSEGLVLYSLHAYERVRDIVTAIQGVLCEARNDWIVYFQGLISEGPEFEELPEDAEDFTVWVYPDKLVATRQNADVLCELLD